MKSQPHRLPPSQPIPPSACARVHEALTPLLSILEAFNHRHKNQHRASHWWAEFSIFRRSARAIASDALHRHGTALVSRARWMKNHIVSRSYLAFTQLAADNQHAPLGLMLLAALARINTVLSDLLPETTQPPKSEVKDEVRKDSAAEESSYLDKGTVVSRQDLLKLRRDATPTSTSSPTTNIAISVSKAGPTAKLESPPRKVEKKKTKKKGSTKKGDEWSSLFDNLN